MDSIIKDLFMPYESKPIPVNAVQWDGSIQQALDIQLVLWLHSAVGHITYVKEGVNHELRLSENPEWEITPETEALHSDMRTVKPTAPAFIAIIERGKAIRVNPNDYIVKNEFGELSVMKPEEFNKVYTSNFKED